MKKNYLDEKKKRLEQKIKVLVSRPAFQKEILDLRKKWKLPPDGIKTEEINQKWNEQLLIDTDEYYRINWPKERKEIIELRKQGKYKEAEALKKEINGQAPLNALSDDIWSIVIRYRLSPRWHNGIRRYLLFNDPKNMQIPAGVTAKIDWEKGIKRISIELDEDTTLNDIKHAWSWVRKMYRGKPADKYHQIPNFDRDKRAYELEQEGMVPSKIADTIQEEFGDALDYNELNIAIKRYKKRLNIS